jgi:xanthine dehydrogenase accessory factor
MNEILTDLDRWIAEGQGVALATVVGTSGSTPRPKGAVMAVTATGEIAGSISGGCLEGAVIQEAMEVLASGSPKLLHYGISDEMAWDVGLSCGGAVDVFVEPLDW